MVKNKSGSNVQAQGLAIPGFHLRVKTALTPASSKFTPAEAERLDFEIHKELNAILDAWLLGGESSLGSEACPP